MPSCDSRDAEKAWTIANQGGTSWPQGKQVKGQKKKKKSNSDDCICYRSKNCCTKLLKYFEFIKKGLINKEFVKDLEDEAVDKH